MVFFFASLQENPFLDLESKLTSGFEKDMKLEAIDPKHPSYICVCTIVRVKGTRLRLHFDGWSESYDFWTSADSPFIFHVGWCEKNAQKLHPPRSKRRTQRGTQSCAFSVLFSFRYKPEQHSVEERLGTSNGTCSTGLQSLINRK